MERKYGWKKDTPDHRDYLFEPKAPFLSIPVHVDLESKCPPVLDQGNLGSCTANAAVSLWDYRQQEELKKKLKLVELYGPTFQPSSRMFVYYNERANEGTIQEDSGATLRDIIYSMAQIGVCPESAWPYTEPFNQTPTAAAYKIAKGHKVKEYKRVPQASYYLRTCLAQDNPFIFGFTVYESFESQGMARSGFMSMPKPGENILGGHEVMCVGYDDTVRCYKVRNSWGAKWGLDGYFWMPYEFMHNSSLCSDMWTFT